MKSKRNVFIEAHRTSDEVIKRSLVSALTINGNILDECIMGMNRIALQEHTWLTDEMCIDRRCKFFVYFDILMNFFPGMDPADVLEVIRVEQE